MPEEASSSETAAGWCERELCWERLWLAAAAQWWVRLVDQQVKSSVAALRADVARPLEAPMEQGQRKLAAVAMLATVVELSVTAAMAVWAVLVTEEAETKCPSSQPNHPMLAAQ